MTVQPKFLPTKYAPLTFDGGLDTDTPALRVPPGYCRKAQNFEIGITGGYRRVAGYERVDGRPAPSDALYYILNATITGSFAVGNTLTGATSGATGVITTASTTGYFVLTKVTGTFQAGENLQITAVTVAVSGGAQTSSAASTAKLNAQYLRDAAAQYRSDIQKVPGSGNVLGVIRYNGNIYAVRNNAGGTAAAIYKSSSSGWTVVTLYNELSFTAGNGAIPAEGATITQGAVSAVVQRVVLESGTWAGGTAAGRFIVANPTGGNFAAGAFTAGVTANASAVQTAITLSPNGAYEFWIDNFTGATGTRRIYGCDGANRGFEFDGAVYVPIKTGMATDTPTHVVGHKQHLFFSFGASVQHSGIGTPYVWSPVSGASELSLGDPVNGFFPQAGSTTGGSLIVYSRNRIRILYGNSASDWNLITYTEEAGAYAYSVQQVGSNVLMMNSRGLTNLTTAINYGNFIGATISPRIASWVNNKRTSLVRTCVNRSKGQWRLFFSDGYVLYATFTPPVGSNPAVVNTNDLRGFMPILFPDAATCVDSREDTDSREYLYFGSSNGYVFQMEKGTSFDGVSIEAYLYLAFNAVKNVRQLKRYKKAMLECAGSGYAEFSITTEIGYASSAIPQQDAQSITFDFDPASWDSSTWDSFIWDGQELAPAELPMYGTAENISLIVASNGDYFEPAIFSGAIIHYVPRRALR